MTGFCIFRRVALRSTPRRIAELAATVSLLSVTSAWAQEAAVSAKAGPDQLAFSITNMDPSVAPGDDFMRYASGGWLKRVQRPDRFASYGFLEIMTDGVNQQMAAVLQRAGQEAATAAPGSPTQQVGTFYNAYMDVDARNAAGITPIQPYLDQIEAIQNLDDLVRLMAKLIVDAGPGLFLQISPDVDLADNHAYAIYAGAAPFSLSDYYEDVLDEPDDGPRLTAYREYLAAAGRLSGQSEADALRIANLAIGIERKLHAAKLTPAESVDLRAIYNPTTLDAVQAQIPQLNLRLLIESQGFAVPDRIILAEPRFFPALSALMDELTIQDIRDYVRLRTVLAFQPYLSTEFDAPLIELNKALVGVGVLPPLEERALGMIKSQLGQPVSQLYVESFFPEETRQQALDMIGQIKTAFQERMPGRDWLSDSTRAAAEEKLTALSFKVGYPDPWIDYSQVSVTSDLVATVAAISRFNVQRRLDKLGKPVSQDDFSTIESLPITINAGYNPVMNGFLVPAAITQPPVFDPSMDAAVNYCRMGAVLGHEMTHGFDMTGKSFDADGNLKNWWTPEDEAAFNERAQLLINQANNHEMLPGLMGNGALEVGENMADVGGITLAYQALQTYLAAHPDENVPIDGLTPDQRCFIAWAQLWTWQGLDEALRSSIANDHHPPNAYRTTAPLQHLEAFYTAFGIKEGDPMWLPPDQRVQAW